MTVRRGHKLTRFRFLRALREVQRVCPTEHRTLIEFTVGKSDRYSTAAKQAWGWRS